jgi:hypothetical protein
MAKRSTKAMIAELNALHEKIGLKLTLELAEDGGVICLGAGWYTDFPTSRLADALTHMRQVAADPDAREANVRAETEASIYTLCWLVDMYGPTTIERWMRRAVAGLSTRDILAVDALNEGRAVEPRVLH